jgi:hypothetical protein
MWRMVAGMLVGTLLGYVLQSRIFDYILVPIPILLIGALVTGILVAWVSDHYGIWVAGGSMALGSGIAISTESISYLGATNAGLFILLALLGGWIATRVQQRYREAGYRLSD